MPDGNFNVTTYNATSALNGDEIEPGLMWALVIGGPILLLILCLLILTDCFSCASIEYYHKYLVLYSRSYSHEQICAILTPSGTRTAEQWEIMARIYEAAAEIDFAPVDSRTQQQMKDLAKLCRDVAAEVRSAMAAAEGRSAIAAIHPVMEAMQLVTVATRPTRAAIYP